MPDELEERALAEAAKRGDEDAWRVLFGRHADATYRYAYVRSARRSDRAEEIVQEAWMIAVRKLGAFDASRGSFGAWLQGITENVLANHRRKWARRDDSETPLDGVREIPHRSGTPGDDRLALAFTELPAEYQDAIHAKYVDGYSMQEIAERWKRTPKAIESLLARARAALREAYTKIDSGRDRNKP